MSGIHNIIICTFFFFSSLLLSIHFVYHGFYKYIIIRDNGFRIAIYCYNKYYLKEKKKGQRAYCSCSGEDCIKLANFFILLIDKRAGTLL